MKKYLFVLLISFQALHAQWVQTNGPEGGFINCIEMSGSNIFIGTNNGVFLSTNNGSSWKPINTGLPDKAEVYSIININSKIFAGGYGSGVFMSTDNGAHWTAMNNGLPDKLNVWCMTTKDSTLYIGCELSTGTTGVYQSTDYGVSWSAVNVGIPTDTYINCIATIDSNIYVGTNAGMFLSTDDGTSWKPINTGFPDNCEPFCLETNGINIYVGTLGNGLFLSTNNGSSWEPINTGLPDNCMPLCMEINGSNIYVGTRGNGLFLSTNNGSSWSQFYNVQGYNTVICLAMKDSTIFVGTSDGLMISTNAGNNWSSAVIGLVATCVTALTANDENIFAISIRPFYVGNDESYDVVMTSDKGNNWFKLFNWVPKFPGGFALNDFLIETKDSTIVVYLYQDNFYKYGIPYLFVSNNLGVTWRDLTDIDIVKTGSIRSIAIIDSHILLGCGGGIVKMSDDYSNWTYLLKGDVLNLAVKDSNIYAATSNGVMQSTDNGSHWNSIGLSGKYVRTIALSDSHLFAVEYGVVYVSDNDGATWSNCNTGISGSERVNSFAIKDAQAFALTGESIYKYSDNDNCWTNVNMGLPNIGITDIAISGSDIYAGTRLGVWRRPLADMITTSDEYHTKLPMRFVLEQNYPNPFNPSTTIRYSLPSSAQVKLTIHDILGREVATLVNEEQSAGWKEVEWNAQNISSGIYYYKLQTGQFVEMKKMILLK